VIKRFIKDRLLRLLVLPSVAVWLLTIAVFASTGPIHVSSDPTKVITASGNLSVYWSCKAALLLLALVFSFAIVARYRYLARKDI
jgi:hypothetical protein